MQENNKETNAFSMSVGFKDAIDDDHPLRNKNAFDLTLDFGEKQASVILSLN